MAFNSAGAHEWQRGIRPASSLDPYGKALRTKQIGPPWLTGSTT